MKSKTHHIHNQARAMEGKKHFYLLAQAALIVMLFVGSFVVTSAYLVPLLEAMDSVGIKGQYYFVLTVFTLTGMFGFIWAYRYCKK